MPVCFVTVAVRVANTDTIMILWILKTQGYTKGVLN
jgi:hypothetical protein